jgi:predicted flap endonuclease-1-like 5' DNA nuclease
MIYLIGQLWFWLTLTAAFAALAGWALATERAAPGEHALRQRRETLISDLMRLGLGEAKSHGPESERELDGLRRMLELRDARIVELEHVAETARERADLAAGRLAELEHRAEAEIIDAAAEVETVGDEQAELRAWRLRYFEQRVLYLEQRAQPASPQAEWRAREAEARAAHLEQEVRALSAPTAPVEESAPFAANADVDILLRWRLLYLERRAAHARQANMPSPDVVAAAERLKWRARYLESRLRRLEPRPVAVPLAQVESSAAPQMLPHADPAKPHTMAAARNGGPDDFTLIEAVSAMQQSTLYSIGVFHFEQIAAWSPANVAWVDQYLRLRGRIDEEQWVEQAGELAREGVAASRRALAETEAS